MSRYFISVPVDLQGPGTVQCGSPALQLPVLSFPSSSSSSFHPPYSSTPLDFLAPSDRGLPPAALHLGGID